MGADGIKSEDALPLERDKVGNAPLKVPTYGKGGMLKQIEDEVVAAIASGRHRFIRVNYANGDMVGHTGVIPAAIKACETVDACLGRIVARLKSRGIRLIVTADHGNAETMVNDDGSVHTAHTTHQVPLVLVDDARAETRLSTGVLGDIAPTILEIMGLPQPEKMTGRSLIEHR